MAEPTITVGDCRAKRPVPLPLSWDELLMLLAECFSL